MRPCALFSEQEGSWVTSHRPVTFNNNMLGFLSQGGGGGQGYRRPAIIKVSLEFCSVLSLFVRPALSPAPAPTRLSPAVLLLFTGGKHLKDDASKLAQCG